MERARIKIQNGGFGYYGRDKEQVFKEIDFRVNAGEVLCLLGPNGTGKSTILKCLGGILSLDYGSVTINNKTIADMKPSDIAKHLGYVPQSLSSAFPFTIRDIVVMGRASHIGMFSSPSSDDIDIAGNAMEKVGISHIADRSFDSISGGEWQLTLIARALAQRPEILLLDEPTSHLDLGNQMKILKVIMQLAQEGMAIVMATHFPNHAFISASHVAVLKDRRIIAMGMPDNVITESAMKAVYNVDVKILQVENTVKRKICVPLLLEVSS